MTVLVFHIGSLGDTIVTIPMLRAVRAHWPDAHLVMLHNAPIRPGVTSPVEVLAGSGLVDAFVPYRRHLTGWRLAIEVARTYGTLRRLRPEVAVFAGPSERDDRALARDRRFLRLAGIHAMTGFRPVTARPGEPEAGRKLRRLTEDGVPVDIDAALALPLLRPGDEARQRARAWVAQQGADADRLVSLGIGSLMPSKAWPLDRFHVIGERLVRLGLVPLVVGGIGERDDGDQLVRGWRTGLNAAGAHTLPDSTALQTLCLAHLGVDSGAAHLAAAVGVRTVVLMGARGESGQWDPIGPGHRVLRHAVPCEGCRLVSCTVPGHPCMAGIEVDEAWRALGHVLEGHA